MHLFHLPPPPLSTASSLCEQQLFLHDNFPLATRRLLDPCVHIYQPCQDVANRALFHIYPSKPHQNPVCNNIGSLVFNQHPVSGASVERPNMDSLMWLSRGRFCICIPHPASSWQETEHTYEKKCLWFTFYISPSLTNGSTWIKKSHRSYYLLTPSIKGRKSHCNCLVFKNISPLLNKSEMLANSDVSAQFLPWCQVSAKYHCKHFQTLQKSTQIR